MRVLALVCSLLLAACSPPGADAPPAATVTDAIESAVANEIGQPASVSLQTHNVEGEWAWVIAQPWTRDGTQIDWSQTRYADRAAEGALDGNGVTYALLRRENGQWRVVEIAIGPTDVAWADWAERHGAPAALMQTN
jgi:hypothetical protein